MAAQRPGGRYPPLKISEVPPADVIVCLGGCAEPSLTEPTGVNFASSIDRVTTALALLAEKKAPLLIVTGGGYLRDGVWYSESDAVVSYFKTKLSVPLNIISLGHCKDTHDEALKIAALSAEKGWKQIILVTSATHLPRAVATFQKAGLSVTPEPSDFISSYYGIVKTSWLHLPQTGSFLGFGSWLHEIIGTWVYRWRGWI